jgi:outer membrane protein assembly factor BamB
MRENRLMPRRACALALAAVLIAACGSSSSRATGSGAAGAAQPASASAAAHATLLDWPQFGLNAAHSGASSASPGISANTVAHLHHLTVSLPGTVDSAPVLLHAVTVGGRTRDVIVATTSYGRTLAVDAASGQILWDFQPAGAARLVGSSQITNAGPAASRAQGVVYAASPDGEVHRLSLADGRETGPGWPVRVTRDATHEKLGGSLTLDGSQLLVVTGGYFGDTPPYQGHILSINRVSGHIDAIFNTLCANRRGLLVPSSCGSSDSAIWARPGAVVEPNGRILVATGNGPYNGTTDFGDSVLELDPGTLALRQAYTPTNQAKLNASDTDLGSSEPALLGSGLVLQGGKDGVLRLLSLARLDGAAPTARRRTGGELQTLPTPGGAELFTQPAVWRHGAAVTVVIADGSGTAAYALRGARLHQTWSDGEAGTSPVLAGGLLYVYDPGGGLRVLSPGTGRLIARLSAGGGHWNSPVVADGRIVLSEGDANDHSSHGLLDIYTS